MSENQLQLNILVVCDDNISDARELVQSIDESQHNYTCLYEDEFDGDLDLSAFNVVVVLILEDSTVTPLTALGLLELCHLHKLPLVAVCEDRREKDLMFRDDQVPRFEPSQGCTFFQLTFPNPYNWENWTETVISYTEMAYMTNVGQAILNIYQVKPVPEEEASLA